MLSADDTPAEGDQIEAGGHQYEVAAMDANDYHAKRADGVRLYLRGDAVLRPQQFGAIGDNESHPLSEKFATLATAQVVYPHATALTDEIDWCAWQALADYIYGMDIEGAYLWSAASVDARGAFVLNRTVTFNAVAVEIRGTPGGVYAKGGQTRFRYTGAAGSVDAPVWMFDFYLFDEFGDPPAGRIANAAVSGGGKYDISGCNFSGQNGSMAGMIGDESNFISGIRIRKATFARVENCGFTGTLWDGVSITDGQLFCTIRRNFFYGVHRDAVAVHRVSGGLGFSTTVWIDNNEFGQVGRYHIFADCRGAIDADFRVRDNSFELGNNGFFPNNIDWWVGGVISPAVFINCSGLIFDGNRFESITDVYAAYWADVHICMGTDIRLTNCVGRNVAISTLKSSAEMTAALSADAATRGYRDITDTRSYNLGDTGDALGGVANLKIDGFRAQKLFLVGGVALSTSNRHDLRDTDLWFIRVPISAGEYAARIGARATTATELTSIGNGIYHNAMVHDALGSRSMTAGGNQDGTFLPVPQSSAVSMWSAEAVIPAATAGLGAANARRPTVFNGYTYQATVGGTTGAAEPTWPTTIGATVQDGTVTWKCTAYAYDAADVGNGASLSMGARGSILRSYSVRTAAPTAGRYYGGEVVEARSPSPGGATGWVCTSGGIPGTWKQMGTVES